MAAAINQVSESSSTGAANATQAAAANSPTGNATMSTQVSTLAQLRKESPKLFNAMMVGIAQNICSNMQRQQSHLKQLMREYRNS